MTTTSHSAAQQARTALGQQLREVRQEAGLSGRALAALAGWHESKVSKIEHARQPPTVEDIRTWCLQCRVSGQVTDDLLAALHAVEGMWIEWRRIEHGGLRRAQESVRPLYERASRFRFYSSSVIPGILQTEEYTTAILRAVARRRDVPDDINEAVAVRMERQRFLRGGDRRFAVLLEESTLRSGIGGADMWGTQLRHLTGIASLPTVSLGVIPFGVGRESAWPVETFYMFDELSELAVYGTSAQTLFAKAIAVTVG